MAVKRVNANAKTEEAKAEEVAVEVDVVETPVAEDPVGLDTVDTEVVEAEDTTVEVEVEAPAKDDTVDVDTESVNVSNKPSGKVKIRMRVDHKCCIAMERYDFKAGKTYTVPENVKRILNKAGLLAPL